MTTPVSEVLLYFLRLECPLQFLFSFSHQAKSLPFYKIFLFKENISNLVITNQTLTVYIANSVVSNYICYTRY